MGRRSGGLSLTAHRHARRIFSAAGLVIVLASVPTAPVVASSSNFKIAVAGPKFSDLGEMSDGEPSIATGPGDWMYLSWPGNNGTEFRRSHDGLHWKRGAIANAISGDTTVTVDRGGSVYQSNLAPVDPVGAAYEVEMYKSGSRGAHWRAGSGWIPGFSASGQLSGVDRQWVDAYQPPGKSTAATRVYISYHDYPAGAGLVWANASTDGGRSFGMPVLVSSDPAAVQAGLCNVTSVNTKVVQRGRRAGRVYVAWIAGDFATSAATGCNYTQLNTYHTAWIAWSDDGGATWTDHLVYDSGFGHDMGVPFADMTLDRAGNPYFALGINRSTEWDMYVEASFDGGKTWNGKTDGTGAPYKVNRAKGTNFFPAIAAGDPGHVDVVWIATNKIVPTLPYGKAQPGGDPAAVWRVYMGQSLNVNRRHPTWTVTRVTSNAIHVGDVCTLGFFCAASLTSNRDLLDFIDVALDSRGLAHIAYTDDHVDDGSVACICVANQISGRTVGRP